MKTVWNRGVYDPLTGFDESLAMRHPAPPSLRHLLGTDTLGRDVLSMLLYASRSTLVMAAVAAFTTATISIIVGAISAYYRGALDTVLVHISDAAVMLPAPIFMFMVNSWAPRIGPVQYGFIYGVLAGLGAGAIMLRSHALKVMAHPFMDPARVAGAGARYMILTHLIPHLIPLAAVYMMLSVTGAIVADGFGSFYAQTRTHLNWGAMVYIGLTYRAINPQIPWNLLLTSGMALSLLAAAFYAVAQGLHEVADPRLRRQ